MGKIKQLPVTTPIIDVNSHHAFALSIIANEAFMLPWIYSQYIQLYGITSSHTDCIHFSTSSRFQHIPHVFLSRLHAEQVRGWFPDPIQFAIDCIDQGCYINTVVDEYEVPNTRFYRKSHFTHNIMVFGYDQNDRSFNIAGYFSDPSQYSYRTKLSFDSFAKAFQQAEPIIQTMNQTIELVRFPYFEPPCKTTYHFDVEHVTACIDGFLTGKPMGNEVTIFNTPISNTRHDIVFGLDVYDLLKHYVEQGQIDMKPMQTLKNHKQMMIARLNYMQANGIVRDEQLQNLFQTTLKRAEVIHNLMLRYILTRNHTDLKTMAQHLKTLKRLDKEAFERLGEAISKNNSRL